MVPLTIGMIPPNELSSIANRSSCPPDAKPAPSDGRLIGARSRVSFEFFEIASCVTSLRFVSSKDARSRCFDQRSLRSSILR